MPWSPFTQFDQVASLASSRAFRLRSSFRPTYNMAANLLQRHEPAAAGALLARSFAQYQTEIEVSHIEDRLDRERRRVADLRESLDDELATLGFDDRNAEPISSEPADAEAIADAVARLRPGDIITDSDGDRLVVLGVSWRRGGRARMRLVTSGGHDLRWELADLDAPPHTVGRVELPEPMTPERAAYRAEVATRLRRARARGGARRERRRQRGDDPRIRLRRAEAEVRRSNGASTVRGHR